MHQSRCSLGSFFGGAEVGRTSDAFIEELLRQEGILFHRETMVFGHWMIV